MLYDASLTVIMISIAIPLKLFLDLSYVYLKIKKFFFMKNPEKSSYLQIEANRLFLGSELNIEYTLSKIISLFYIGLFFMPIFPLGSIFLLFSFTTSYFIEKYLFARRYQRPKSIGANVAIDSIYRLGLGGFFLFVKKNIKKIIGRRDIPNYNNRKRARMGILF